MKMTNVLIVESPGKIANIKKYLNSSNNLKHLGEFNVIACQGHIRDLDKSGPDSGVIIEKGFKPIYVDNEDKEKVIQSLKSAVSKAKMVYLASDKDMQGEAISYHLKELLHLDEKHYERIVFTEINQKALENAINNPRKIDMNLFHAQEAQRILDRLVGFKISKILWNHFTTKNKSTISAGRVQSAALHIIIENENEIKKFKSSSYWNVSGNFELLMSGTRSQLEDVKLYNNNVIKKFTNIDDVQNLFKNIQNKFTISDVKKREAKQNADLPFTTSTLQQESYSKLGFTLKSTMALAQELYEAGHITYMRTDSYNISEEFKEIAAKYIVDTYGIEFLEQGGSKKKAKVNKNAQNAHECVRCTDPYMVTPDKLKSNNALVLYQLIWKRTIAYLMKPCVSDELDLFLLNSNTKLEKDMVFITTLKQVKFIGFQIVYSDRLDSKSIYNFSDYIANIKNKKYSLNCESLYSKNIWSAPPQRFNESTIIKELEGDGIGKPSTYATILSTLFDRQYVLKSNVEGTQKDVMHVKLVFYNPNQPRKTQNKITIEKGSTQFGAEQAKLTPTEIGIMIDRFLSDNFADIVDKNFTARMEANIDKIALGQANRTDVLDEFWEKLKLDIAKVKVLYKSKDEKVALKTETKEIDVNGVKYVMRLAQYGPVIQYEKTYIPLKDYLATAKKGYMDINEDDVQFLTSLPRDIGKLNGKIVQLMNGRYGLYLKYDGKNVATTKKFKGNIVRGKGEDIDMEEVKGMVEYSGKKKTKSEM